MFNKRWEARLKELRNAKKFLPPNPAKDSAELKSLVGFLNNPLISGASPPPKEKPPVTESPKAAPIVEEPTQRPPATSQSPVTAAPVITLNRVCMTGRFLSGKDYVCEQAGLTIFSLAEPLYALQKFFFGTDDKTVPGAREFLQAAGQIGRGLISAEYPLSIQRANFIALVREQANRLTDDLSVDWQAYGRHENLWLDAMLCRVRKHLTENPGARVAVTNARFSNEFSRLTAEGFSHFHTMCSAATWSARLQKVGLSPDSPACKDISEQLAASLDASVTKTLSQQPRGNKLRCVFSDSNAPAPSSRLLSVAEFVALFK